MRLVHLSRHRAVVLSLMRQKSRVGSSLVRETHAREISVIPVTEVRSCGTGNAAAAGVSAIFSTGVYGTVDVDCDVTDETVDVRFDARCGFFRTGAGRCISVREYGMDWWMVWVGGFWM